MQTIRIVDQKNQILFNTHDIHTHAHASMSIKNDNDKRKCNWYIIGKTNDGKKGGKVVTDNLWVRKFGG